MIFNKFGRKRPLGRGSRKQRMLVVPGESLWVMRTGTVG